MCLSDAVSSYTIILSSFSKPWMDPPREEPMPAITLLCSVLVKVLHISMATKRKGIGMAGLGVMNLSVNLCSTTNYLRHLNQIPFHP